MSDTSIELTITAQTAELQSKLATAKAQVGDFHAEIKDLANGLAAAAASGTSVFTTSLQNLTVSATAAKSELEALKGQLNQGPAASHAPQRPSRSATSGADREAAQAERDLDREINQELRERVSVIQSTTAVSNAHYARLREDIKLAMAEGKISADQEVAQLTQLENDKYAATMQGLQEKLSLYRDDEAQYRATLDREKIVTENHYAALDHLSVQRVQNDKKAALEDQAAWRTAISAIDSAEATLVHDIFSRRQSLTQSLVQLGSRLVQEEITNDLKYYTNKLLYSALGLTAEKSAAQGGVLAHLLAESTKSSATAAGVGTRTAAENTGQTGFLGQVATRIARWLGMETANSAATDASASEQTAASTAAAVAARTISVAQGMSEISVAAAVAAANAFASTAAIPMVGLELAPEAAVAAYAATMGWAAGMGGGVALEVGAWEIPGTMAATLHQGEMVVPANFADGLRGAVGAPSSTTPAAGVTFAPQVSALDAKSVVALFNNPSIMRQFARNLSAYMALNPSTRGAY